MRTTKRMIALAGAMVLAALGTATGYAMPVANAPQLGATTLVHSVRYVHGYHGGRARVARGAYARPHVGYAGARYRGRVVGRPGRVVWTGRPGMYGGWYRPYRWAPGAAVATGAAIGFLGAAAATSYYSSPPPAPGLCWYYTDPSGRAGFWDVCP
jgi:hypothetical protein